MRKLDKRAIIAAAATGLALALATPGYAADTIKIGVIAEAQAVAASSIPLAAQLAADEINAAGGVDGKKIEIVSYDNHSSLGNFGDPALDDGLAGSLAHRLRPASVFLSRKSHALGG